MNDKVLQFNKSMSREDLKRILFDWLKDKGILEELQVFLRAKMVEKLQGTSLRSTKKSSDVTSKDHALNMIVCNYLKQSQMHYTLSVFASECPSLQSLSSLNDNLILENVYSVLKIENLSERIGEPVRENHKCILQDLVDACSVMCTQKFQSRYSQHSNIEEIGKLFINVQSQTETQKVSLTKAAQTKTTCNITAQTEVRGIDSEDKATVEEMNKLRRQLEESQSMLKSCQLQLQESRRNIENLVNNKLKFSVENDPHLFSEPRHEFSLKNRNHISNQDDYNRRIHESRQFLCNLDNHLENLDDKYSSLTGKNYTNKQPTKLS